MYHLKLKSETKTGRTELTDKVYWYPLKVRENLLMSVNITKRSIYDNLEKRWKRGGRVIVSSPIDHNYKCFLYFGTIGDPKILPMFGERPLMVEDQFIHYFFPDDDFNNIYNDINIMRNLPQVDDVSIRKKQSVCLDFFKEYFSTDWSVSLNHIKSKSINRNLGDYDFQTTKIGLHPLLHLIQLIPVDEWYKEYYKKMLVCLFKNDFLVDWSEVHDIENPDSGKDILHKCKKISRWETATIPMFEDALKDMIKQLINKHEFFGILYLASQSASESSVIKALFNNLFEFIPREQREWIGYPRFQPKLIVNEIEVHFIQRAGQYARIESMANDLKKIFDDIDFYSLSGRGYRFICKVILPTRDYFVLPERVGNIYCAVKAVAKKNNLLGPANEMWIKRLGVKFITPPQFEDDVLLAFSKNWFFKRKPRALDELDEENRRKTLSADMICDYRVYENKNFLFSFNYSQDVQNSYIALNDLLCKNHNFMQFGEMEPRPST